MIKEPPSVTPVNFKLSRSAFLYGKNRYESVAESNSAEIFFISEAVKTVKEKLFGRSNWAHYGSSLENIIKLGGIDAVVIAAIIALNADEKVRLLQKGNTVFFRKHLQRNAAEPEEANDAEGMSFNHLWTDFSYPPANYFIEYRSTVTVGDFDHTIVSDRIINNSSF